MGPLLPEVREGGRATPQGLSYLEARQLLLLQYASCIVAYLLLKAEGRSVRNHPVIGRWGCLCVCVCVCVCARAHVS